MKFTILLASLFVFSVMGLAQDTIQTSDYSRVGEKVFYGDSLFTGVAIKKAPSGQIINEEHYQDGVAHGIWREWYATGAKKFVGGFKDGVNDGIWTQWNQDGKIQRRLTFKNGKLVPNQEE